MLSGLTLMNGEIKLTPPANWQQDPYPSFNSVDKFGIKEFYPTKENGLEWFADWNQSRIIKDHQLDPYDSRLGVTHFSFPDHGLIIGEGRAKIRDFDKSPRIYVKGPWLNTEQTVYIKILDTGKVASIQLRSRANHDGVQHLPYTDMGVDPTTGKKDISCGFGNYLVRWGEGQINFVSVEVEIIHGLYREIVKKPFTMPINKYVGFKTITRIVEDGKVKLEGYNNLDVSSQSNWKKTIEFLFDGKNSALPDSTLAEHEPWLDYCKDKGDKISGDLNNHQIWNNPSYWNWIRINNAENVWLKYYSVREIQ